MEEKFPKPWTGSMGDPRSPTQVTSLKEFISKNSLGDTYFCR